MKLVELLEFVAPGEPGGSGGSIDPKPFLKVGNRARWDDRENDQLMFGDVRKVTGNIVDVTDDKFGSKEIYKVKIDQIFEILEPKGNALSIVWRKN
jgi:hypothetical protein